MPIEASRLPHSLSQWGWDPWQGKASTLSAVWILAQSLAGWAGQEHPSLAGKMLTLYRSLDAQSSAGWSWVQLTGPETEAGQGGREEGRCKERPLEGEPEQSCGTSKEFHEVIP